MEFRKKYYSLQKPQIGTKSKKDTKRRNTALPFLFSQWLASLMKSTCQESKLRL